MKSREEGRGGEIERERERGRLREFESTKRDICI